MPHLRCSRAKNLTMANAALYRQILEQAALKLRPIKTAADYRAALAEVERLCEARPGTPTGDRLDILTTLVEACEEEHWPLPSPDPVEAIRYTMESRGLTGDDLAKLMTSA